jgi:hypothetical protein
MRVLRDVLIQRSDSGELQAVSQQSAIAGEEMTLDLVGGGDTIGLRVKVIDSRPVMVNGAVRHRIRLTLLDGGSLEPAMVRADLTQAEAL